MEFLAETRWDWITEKKMEPFTLQGEANKFFSGSLHFFWVMLRYYCIPHHPLILYSFFLCLNTLYEVTVNSSEILACPNCHFLIFSSSSSSPFHSYLINNLAVGSISLSPQNSEGTIPLLLRSSVVNEMCVCFVISLVSPKALRIFYFFSFEFRNFTRILFVFKSANWTLFLLLHSLPHKLLFVSGPPWWIFWIYPLCLITVLSHVLFCSFGSLMADFPDFTLWFVSTGINPVLSVFSLTF